jgi:predicted glycogen debranching enzyme
VLQNRKTLCSASSTAGLALEAGYGPHPDLLTGLQRQHLFKRDGYLKLLEFALRDFQANDDIVAGYPWYGAWGRDTMIVLNALLHAPNCVDQVEKVLRKYSRHLSGGLIPNMLPESGRELNYDSIDATLWYIILLWKLGKRKQNVGYWKEVIHLCEEILKSILNNYQYPFEIRKDGLISLKSEFAHATWMDVRLDGKAVTPRDGAPVEINALWYNALCCYEAMCESYQQASGIPYHPLELLTEVKDLVLKSFENILDRRISGRQADRRYSRP